MSRMPKRRLAVAGSAGLLVALGALAFVATQVGQSLLASAEGLGERANTVHARTRTASEFPAGIAKAIPGSGLAGPLNLLTVEPRVPRVAGTPCVVPLFTHLPFDQSGLIAPFSPDFAYSPPSGCPGPWAKVILKMAFTGPGNSDLENMYVSLDNGSGYPPQSIRLFMGAPQFNSESPVWRIERDVTDYSALLGVPRGGYARKSDFDFANPMGGSAAIGTAQLLFYPATAQVPATRRPDAVYLVRQRFIPVPQALPRNMDRIYVDVYSQVAIPWFACMPQHIVNQYPELKLSVIAMGNETDNSQAVGGQQGCIGDGFLELVLTIDGVPAGVAPVFPWLHSDVHRLFRRSVDIPVPAVQALSFMPQRFDLTPFAALLNDGAEHMIDVGFFNFTRQPFDHELDADLEAHLLVFLDHGRQQLTGQVTRNTLASEPPDTASLQDEFTLSGDTLEGWVLTKHSRIFEIAGYLDTSQGRVYSRVQQASWFRNSQTVRLDGFSHPEQQDYHQGLQMASTMHRTSSRRLGMRYLSIDRDRYTYPLQMDWRASGGRVLAVPPVPPDDVNYFVPRLDAASFAVHQGREQKARHSRPARATYVSTLSEQFDASRTRNFVTGVDANWKSSRAYTFNDNSGSCYRAALTTFSGVLTSSQAGVGCPGDRNRVVWFAHPDGSPSNLLWVK